MFGSALCESIHVVANRIISWRVNLSFINPRSLSAAPLALRIALPVPDFEIKLPVFATQSREVLHYRHQLVEIDRLRYVHLKTGPQRTRAIFTARQRR